MIKNIKIILIMLILLSANQVLAEHYPKPMSFVSDYANAIPDDKKQALNNLLQEIQKNTTAEIAVLVIESLGGLPVETYAVEVFQEWGIGKKGVDNGLLMLISINDREYRLEVGYGLEGVLPDALAGRIARENFIPNFRAGDYAKGIYNALLDIRDVILKDPSVMTKYPSEEKSLFILGLLLFLIIAELITNKIVSSKKKKIIDWETQLITTGMIFVIILYLELNLSLFYLLFYKPIYFVYILFKYLSTIKVPKGKYKGGEKEIMIGRFRFKTGGESSGGSFGGFGGGRSGGGGASGKW